jgi:hypothetical protein
MKPWSQAVAAAAAVLAIGCANITTSAHTAPGTDLANYRTYDWYEPPSGKLQTIGEQQMRTALQQDLALRGLTLATSAAPDFLVAYHAVEQPKADVAPGYAWGSFPDVVTYREGTLVVDFIDRKTNTVFWRGTARGAVDHPSNPDPQKINEAVAKLIKQYPSAVARAS